MEQGGDFSFLNIDVKHCKTTRVNKTLSLPESGVSSFSAGFYLAV